jgi:hypothetical protein
MTIEIAERLGSRLTLADYRHVAAGVGRKVVGERFAAGYNKQLDRQFRPATDTAKELSLGEEYNGEDLLELQNGRSTVVGMVVYVV